MKIFLISARTLRVGLLCCFSASIARAETALIDFTNNHRDADGRQEHPYEYAWGDWGKGRVKDMGHRGVLIQAPNGKGGMGENRTQVPFRKTNKVDLIFLIGNANESSRILFAATDSDGTKSQWYVDLDNKPSGQVLKKHIDLDKPDNTYDQGKKPGFDSKKVVDWQVQGDSKATKVEVLLIKLVTAE